MIMVSFDPKSRAGGAAIPVEDILDHLGKHNRKGEAGPPDERDPARSQFSVRSWRIEGSPYVTVGADHGPGVWVPARTGC